MRYPEQWIRLSPLVDTERVELEELAARLRARDGIWMERVLRELLPLVRRVVHRLLGPHRDREDAVQDAMAAIAAALYRFEGRSSISTLAQRITVRVASRHYARHRAEFGDPDLDARALAEDECGSCPERAASVRQRVARLYHHLESLSEARRTAFVLCVIEEMSPTEAALIVGCSAVALRSRLFEARRELDERLKRDPVLSCQRERLR